MPITVYMTCGVCGKLTKDNEKQTCLKVHTPFGFAEDKLQAYHRKCLDKEGIRY